MSRRAEMLGSTIQQELAQIIMRELNDPRLVGRVRRRHGVKAVGPGRSRHGGRCQTRSSAGGDQSPSGRSRRFGRRM